MIERHPLEASGGTYDIVVVGGGIQGVALALEAARRGQRPLLLERRDFGGATSWNSLRIVHGGLRYLQTLDLSRFRQSVAERSWLLRHFPDLVERLPCLLPLYGHGLRRPFVLRAALAADHYLSRGRNRGLPDDRKLPAGRVLSARETLRQCPSLEAAGLVGGARWYDGFVPSSQRLLIEMLRWAVSCGAVALNYVSAKGVVVREGRVEGIEAVDRESGRSMTFRAPVVVNCAGPWCRELAASFDRDVPELMHLSLAFNLLLGRQPICESALAVAPRGGRTYFLVPRKGQILAGTYHVEWTRSRGEGGVDDALVHRFLEDLNTALPALSLRSRDVLRIYWGFLPARERGSVQLRARELIHDHAPAGGPKGLFSVSGVKFTTARSVAEKTLRRIASSRASPLASRLDRCRPPAAPWPSLTEIEALLERKPEEVAVHLRRIASEEAVLQIEDLLLRRTDWGTGGSGAGSLAARLTRLWERQEPGQEALRRLQGSDE